MTEMTIEQTPDLGDYLSAFRRRRGMVLLISSIVFAVGLIVAFVWPPTYQASSTILIEEQEIPNDLVRSTVTSYAAQRIQVISQRVMRRSNLMEIINKYNLYEGKRKRATTEEVLIDMREDISVELINAEVVDPRTGRPRAATIAFTLGFESDNAEQAQKVAGELTTLYLNENLRARTEKAAETYDFLTVESDRLKDEINRLEKILAEFKEENINTLPEQRRLNSQILAGARNEITKIDNQVQGLQESKVILKGQLALIDPYTSGEVISPAARLDALRMQYTMMTSRYSEDHPDAISARKQIRALERQTGNYASTDELRAELDALQQELENIQQTYTDEHPDVRSLKRRIAVLEEDINSPRPQPVSKYEPVNPDNPAYVNLQNEVVATDSAIRLLKAERAKLVEKVEEYETRLMQTPKAEQEFRAIARDLQNASMRYQEIKAKQMTAEVAQELEKERKGEKFTLIDPAIRPEEPVSPNRPAIIFLSLVLAIGAGVGSGAIRESLDSTVRGARGMVAILHTAPLAVIPYLPSAAEDHTRKKKRRIMVITVIASIIMILLLVHFLFTPLDVLWFKGIRKVDIMVGS